MEPTVEALNSLF